ncbi:helix-turn-helix domain-containing protein [Salipiger mucosus]|uniref:Transcriptional regulator, AraC family n=1 Tax=Salipiger mucosus DSM 16094 TaxID=1123237 RepID=S9R098_9RHOB|nr:helix-turn-helix domain-containing protein [Salipiger mucosus]EPX85287.1 transcriptional regulator, AraC family [Salipiger mucosus DSM 16094]
MARLIPTYELYGELLSGALSDPIHLETIFERSSKLDWTIRLHRHSRLLQVFLFRTAGVSFRVGDGDHRTGEPLILVVPPGTPHAFRFPEDINGDVLTIPLDEIEAPVLDRVRQVTQPLAGFLARSATPRFADVDALMRQLRQAYHSVGSEREPLLRALSHALVLTLIEELRRTVQVDTGRAGTELSRHEAQAQAFCEEVEARFAESVTVEDYARAVGVSAPHLTRICKRVLGTSPNELVRRRRMLEAKRLLSYTRLPVLDIAHRAGFGDAAFFSRTFKTTFGVTPSEFRRQSD